MFVHNNRDRQMALWLAIESALSAEKRVCPESRNEYTFAEYSTTFSKEYSWQLLNSYWYDCMKLSRNMSSNHDQVIVIIRHSSGTDAKSSKDMITSWFQCPLLVVNTVHDDCSSWNFEITVNGVLVHSRNRLYHRVLHEDDWDQQSLVWKAIKGVLNVESYAGA